VPRTGLSIQVRSGQKPLPALALCGETGSGLHKCINYRLTKIDIHYVGQTPVHEPMNTIDQRILAESEDLAARLAAALVIPLFDDSQRIRVSHLASSVALEHSKACRTLLANGFVPSGLVVHRAQYEAAVRAVWVLYAASELQVEKLAATLGVETEQEAKNLPLVADMMAELSSKAPSLAYQTLANFKDSSWKVLNSFVHAGIHPLQRQQSGYPVRLVEQILRNCNGLAVVAGMQAAMLTGNQTLVSEVVALQKTHRECLPSTGDEPR
jgi:hypothetical protein